MRFMKYLRWSSLVVGVALVSCAPLSPEESGVPSPEPDVERAEERHEERREVSPVVLGVLVPQTGSDFLVRYGERVLEGVRLAVEEHEREGGRPVELVVLDDRGDADRSAGLIGRLEGMGAVGVIGPLTPAGIGVAANAREDEQLPILSPTAGELMHHANTYTLNTGDTHGAVILAEHALSTGLRRAALLYPRHSDHRRQANAFRDAFTAGGGQVVAEQAYLPGTTTFSDPILALVDARPDAVYVPASEDDVLQIAPQLTYYGLAGSGVQVLGGEAWTTDVVQRRVSSRYLDGVVAATPLVRSDAEIGWQDFLEMYEMTYRRTLDNPFPALGHDAARLVLATLDFDELDAGTVSERITGLQELRGATGLIGIEGGAVVRRPFLVRIEEGEIVPITRR